MGDDQRNPLGYTATILDARFRSEAYMKGYAAALEDAARVCEEAAKQTAGIWHVQRLLDAAERIRALKD